MQLRRAVPLSLVALLASAGCVSVGPQDTLPDPVRGAIPPAEAPDVPAPLALPLGQLPTSAPQDAAPDRKPDRIPDPHPEPPVVRTPGKTAAPPRRTRAQGPASTHPRRRPAPAPRMDAMCAAAEGVVPPSIVDLCLRQYGH